MTSEKKKERLIDETVEQFQKPIKDFARVRDANSILCIILISAVIIHMILGIFSFLEIEMIRFNQVLLFCIIWTVALGLYIIAFIVAKIVIYFTIGKGSEYDPPLTQYDRRIVHNMQEQCMLNFTAMWPSVIIIVIRWTYYGQVGANDSFSSLVGFLYGLMALSCFAMHLVSILVITNSILSYYYRYIPTDDRKKTLSMYKENVNFYISREIDPVTGNETANILYR
jgi:hypothetical protein